MKPFAKSCEVLAAIAASFLAGDLLPFVELAATESCAVLAAAATALLDFSWALAAFFAGQAFYFKDSKPFSAINNSELM